MQRHTVVKGHWLRSAVLGVSLPSLLFILSAPQAHAALDLNDSQVVYAIDNGNPDNTSAQKIFDYINPNPDPHFSQNWSATGLPLLPDLTGADTAAIQFVVLRSNPRKAEQFLGVQYSFGPSTNRQVKLHLFRSTGDGTWQAIAGFPVFLRSGNGKDTVRYFDLAFEQRSGQLLVVYADPNQRIASAYRPYLLYRLWDGSSWASFCNTTVDDADGSFATFEGAAISGPCRNDADALKATLTSVNNVNQMWWVKLVPRPNSDEIMVMASDSNGNLPTRLWRGLTNDWLDLSTDVKEVESNTAPTAFDANGVLTLGLVGSSQRPFDGAFEGRTGAYFLAAFIRGTNSEIGFRTYDRTVVANHGWKTKVEYVDSSLTQKPDMLSVAGEPNTGRIATGMMKTGSGEGIWGAMWDDTLPGCVPVPTGQTVSDLQAMRDCWEGMTKLDDTISDVYATSVNGSDRTGVVWAGNSGTALLLWAQKTTASTHSFGLDYAKWIPPTPPATTGLWQSQPDANPGNVFLDVPELSFAVASFNNLPVASVVFSENIGSGSSPVFHLYNLLYDASIATEASRWSKPWVEAQSQDLSTGQQIATDQSVPFGMSVNSYVVPTLSVSGAPSPIQVAVPSSSTTTDLGVTLTITDPAGMIQADEASPAHNDGDTINDKEIAITLPNNGVKWDLGKVCLSGTAVKTLADPKNKLSHSGVQGGCAAGWFEATPGYSADGKVLYLNVIKDFTFNDTLQMTSLGVSYDGTVVPSGAQPLTVEVNTFEDTDTTKDVDVSLANPPQLQVVESLLLDEPGAGQVKNLFLNTGSATGELFRARLTPKGGNVSLNSLKFRLDSVKGITSADISGLELWMNGVKVTAAELDPVTPWSTAIDPASGTGSMTVKFSPAGKLLAKDTTYDLSLKATVSNLAVPLVGATYIPDQLQIDLEPSGSASNIVATGASGVNLTTVTTPVAAIRGAVTSKLHAVATYIMTGLPTTIAFNNPLSFQWTPINISGATTFTALIDADAPVSFACSVSGVPPYTCTTTVPTSSHASTNVKLQASGSDGDGQTVTNTSVTFTVTEVLELADHSSGQLNPDGPSNPTGNKADNAFRNANLTNINLFRLKLIPYGLRGSVPADNIATNLVLTITPGGGLAMGDFTAWTLIGSDGSTKSGTVVGSTVTLSGVAVKGTTDYVLTSTVTKVLNGGESVKIDASTGAIAVATGSVTSLNVANAAVVTNGLKTTATALAVTHTRPGFTNLTAAPQVGSTQLIAGKNATVGWTPISPADPNVTFEFYHLSSDATPAQTIAAFTSAANNWPVPSSGSASSTAKVCIRETSATYAYIRGCSTAPLQILETVARSFPSVPNAFLMTGSINDKDLYKVTLQAGGGSVKVTRLKFDGASPFSGGMSWSNVTKLQLFESGTASALVTKACPPVGAACPANADFTSLTSVITEGAASAKTYTLKGSFINLQPGYQMTLTMNAHSFDGVDSGFIGLSTIAGTVSGAITSMTHTVSTYTFTAPTAGQAVKFQTPLTVSWTPSNVGQPTKFEYSVDARLANDPTKVWKDFTGNGGCVSGATNTCATDPAVVTPKSPLSDVVTPNAMIRLTGTENPPGTQTVTAASGFFKIAGFLTLDKYTIAGLDQSANAFTTFPTVTNAELFRFKLTPTGETVNIPSLTLGLVLGNLASTDIDPAALQLIQDGTPLSATFAVNATAIIATTPSLTVASGSTSQFILKGNVNLAPGATMTISLVTPSGVSGATGATSGVILSSVSGALTGAVPSAMHMLSGYAVTQPAISPPWPVVQTLQQIQWSPAGSAGQRVNISYTTNADDPAPTWKTIITNFDPAADTPPQLAPPYHYTWSVPTDAITAQAKIRITDASNPAVVGYSGNSATGAPANDFSITGQLNFVTPLPDLRYANGKPRWPVGKSKRVAWDTVGVMTLFDLYLDGAKIGSNLTSRFVDPFTPGSPSAGSQFRVVDVTLGHPMADKFADVIFSEVHITAPTQTDALPINQSATITWISTGLDKVDLWYTTDDGLSFSPIASGQTGTSYVWSVPASARSPHGKIEIRDGTDPANGAIFRSPQPFRVYGQVQVTDPPASIGVNQPFTITWTTPNPTVPKVSLYLVDLSNGQVTTLAANVDNSTGSGSYPNWTPSQPMPQAKLRICDADFANNDLNACDDSTQFAIIGISVRQPLAGNYVVGSTTTIAWDQTNLSGNAVDIFYSTDGGATYPNTVITNWTTGASGSYSWTIPDAIGTNVKVKVKDHGGPVFGESSLLTVIGKLDITGVTPVKSSYAVGDTINVAWQRSGSITDLKLQYCANTCTTTSNWHDGPVLNGISAATGTFSGWAIPSDAISASLQLRVVDVSNVTPAHPAAQSSVFQIVVTPGLNFTLGDPSPWIANETRKVQWNITGLIDKLQLLYSIDGGITFLPMAQTPEPNGVVCNTASGKCDGTSPSLNWSGRFNWKVIDPVMSHDAGPSGYQPKSVIVKAVDTSTNHVPIADAKTVSVIYLKVIWQVKDLTNQTPLARVSAFEVGSVSGTTWNVTDDSLIPNSPFGDPPGILHYYATDTYTTTWTKQGASEAYVAANWLAGRSQLVDFNGDGVIDPTVDGIIQKAFLDLDVNKQQPWNVRQNFQFQPLPAPAVGNVLITGWLEKRGLLYDQVSQITIEIRAGNNQVIKTLTSSTPDQVGVFRLTWDLTDSTGNPVNPDVSYFAKATITTTAGSPLTSGEALAMAIPKKILTSTATGGGSSGPDVSADVAAIKAATVGAGSALDTAKNAVTTTLPQQLTNAQTAIQNNITAAQGAIQADVANVKSDTLAIKSDTTAIKTQTDKISAEVIPAINGVKTYLEDPNAGLPKVLANQTTMKDQLKAQRKGHILNRETNVEQGDTVTIHYAPGDPATVPTIKIDGPGFSKGPVPMAPDGSGLYQFSQTFDTTLQVGEYTVVVTEAASAAGLSDGTVDNLSLKLHAPIASAQDLTALAGKVDALATKLDADVIPRLTAISTTSSQVHTLVTQVQSDTQSLSDKVGTLSTQELQAQMASLIAKIGTLNASAPTTNATNATPSPVAASAPATTTAPSSDTAPLLQRLDELKKSVESAQGSSAAVGLSQSAYAAASEAVALLKQLQAQLHGPGVGAPNAALLLGQVNDKLGNVAGAVTVIPGKMTGEELSQELKQMVEQAKAMATEKGYHFDSLYEIAENQATDVKTVRNKVEELKQLLETQRNILERNLNQPVVKSWFEAQ